MCLEHPVIQAHCSNNAKRVIIYFYYQKKNQKTSALNVNNFLSQWFHITSNLGLNLRPIQTISISLADFREDNRNLSHESGAQVTQAPELAVPFPY